jgi:beta-glucosidase
VLFTSHGAQELGAAIGETLAGRNNPAGRLSQTWYQASETLPHINDYDIVKNKMTYLYCDRPVLHAFGYGLSYTNFAYKNLTVTKTDGGVTAAFCVTNTGDCAGDEVAQLYFTHVNAADYRPLKQLAGFERITLTAGETREISIFVPLKELSFYDPEQDAFTFTHGTYRFMAGASSADVRLTAEAAL